MVDFFQYRIYGNIITNLFINPIINPITNQNQSL